MTALDDVDGAHLEPGAIKPTRRMLVVPTLGLLLWGAGANAGAGFLVMLAGGLLATVPWAWWTVRRASRSVRVRRTVPSRCVAGEPVEVSLRVTVAVTGSVVIHDALTQTVGTVAEPRTGQHVTARTALRRGLASGGVVTVEVTDPFGLFRSSVSGLVPSMFEVLPAVHPLGARTLASPSRQQSEERPRRRGPGSETDGTRDYRHGDSPRAVHWRSSARRTSLVVREFVSETSGSVRLTVRSGPWTAPALDAACVMAASLAEAAERAGARVDLLVGETVVGWEQGGHRVLASLTPNIETPTGTGRPSVAPEVSRATVGQADVEIVFQAQGPDLAVLSDRGGTLQALGVFTVESQTAASEAATMWLREHLDGPVGGDDSRESA